MRLGVAIQDTWDFFHEIYAEFAAHHEVSLFEPQPLTLPVFNTRLNRMRSEREMHSFLDKNEIVFFEWASGYLAEATRYPKTCGIVTRMHRFEMYLWVDKVDWSKVDKLIVVSRAKRDEFVARFPDYAPIVEVITEAIDLDKFQFQPKPFSGNLGILCHLRPRKRVYEAILAFAGLCRQQDDLHLYIGGGGAEGFHEYPIALAQLVEQLGLQAKVTFEGNISDNSAWFEKIDIFISNGYSEGWQVSLIEAMASGCYCLSHQWAGAAEYMPSEQLYFTDQDFQQLVLTYSQLPEAERQRLLTCQREIVEAEFDMSRTRVRIRELVEAVARGKTG